MWWFLILMGIGYVAVNILILILLFRWMNTIGGAASRRWLKIPVGIIYCLMALTLIGWILFDDPKTVHAIKYLNNIWIGVFVYLVICIVIAEIVTLICYAAKIGREGKGKRTFRIVKGAVVMVVVLSLSIYGTIHWQEIKVNEFTVNTTKASLTEDFDIALVADLHLGYSVGCEQMEQMVRLINEKQVDLVLVAGDIIDNDISTLDDRARLEDILTAMESTYGVYAVYGNHDVEERLLAGFTIPNDIDPVVDGKTDVFLRNCGWKMLEDDVVSVAPGIELIGRIDAEKPNDQDKTRMTLPELIEQVEDPDAFLINMEHEPCEIQEASQNGIDLDVHGHTHAGQLFPGTLTIHLFWDNAVGMKQFGNMTDITTSGCGVWGPAMRVGCDSEIVLIHVHQSEQ